MSCVPFDLKDYFFGELAPQDRRTVDLHLAACPKCREELDSLNLTQSALLMVRDEEPPSRIAFVSDKVFEPRWYQSLWNSGPKMAFASAALLSAAILVHGVQQNRPVQTPAPIVQAQRSISEADVTAAVQKAVAEVEARQSEKFQQVLAQQKNFEGRYQKDMEQVSETFGYINRRMPPNYRAANVTTGEGQ